MKKVVLVLFLPLFALCVLIMNQALSYSGSDILIGGKYWSDFGAQLPIIRFFSQNHPFPVEHPLFPGEKIRYHFLFYQLVGAWEQVGMRIDFVLNIPSILGLFSMGLLIFVISYRLFRSLYVSVISTLFIYFNGSLTWLVYLENNNFSLFQSIKNLTSQINFASFAPWNSSIVSAFWNLNIYTNQRHLGFSFALALLVIYLCLSKHNRLQYLIGFIVGSLLLINQPVALILGVFLLSFFITESRIRKPLLLSSLGTIPWIFLYFNIFPLPHNFEIAFGFLQKNPITPISFFMYWFSNIGLHLVLIPLGLIVSIKKSKPFIVPLLILFIVPNIIKMSPDIINNHKFFNFFLLFGGIFSAYAIKKLKFVGAILLPFLILGGIVDIFPILNDRHIKLPDVKSNPEAIFFTQVPTDSVVLNSTWFYHPASLTGRKIYNGYPYFTWSYGYDQVAREDEVAKIYASNTKEDACRLLLKNSINYVELNPNHEEFISINQRLWNQDFYPEYTNTNNGIKIYNVKTICTQ